VLYQLRGTASMAGLAGRCSLGRSALIVFLDFEFEA